MLNGFQPLHSPLLYCFARQDASGRTERDEVELNNKRTVRIVESRQTPVGWKMSQVIKISLDDMGRILIPAAVQSRLGLSPGMSLVVEEGDQGSVRLRVQSELPVLVDKAGVLVVRAEPIEDLANVTRRERDRRVFELIQRAAP